MISGDGGNDTLYGNAGNDKIYGGAGDDFVRGDNGWDSLYGEAGRDTLRTIDTVKDILHGGTADNFVDIYQKDALDQVVA